MLLIPTAPIEDIARTSLDRNQPPGTVVLGAVNRVQEGLTFGAVPGLDQPVTIPKVAKIHAGL